MDSVLSGTRPKLVKMDLQGAEPLEIEGMKQLLQGESPPQVIVEYDPPCAITAGFKPRELVDRLTGLQPRYRVYMIDWRLGAIEPTDDVLRSLIGPRGEVNLLFRGA